MNDKESTEPDAPRNEDEVSDEQRTDWNVTEADLLPPFNLWPRWAVELDIEIADLIGDIGARDEEDTSTGRAEIAAYVRVREIIRSMVVSNEQRIIPDAF